MEQVKQRWCNNSKVRMLEVQGPRTQRGVVGGNKWLQSKQTDNESSLFEVEAVLEQVVRQWRNDRASVLEVHEA